MCLLSAAGKNADRIVCVDGQGRCTGVVTASDIISYFLREGPVALRPLELARFPGTLQEMAAASAAAAAAAAAATMSSADGGVGLSLGDGGSM
jgi:hypothetical protein